MRRPVPKRWSSTNDTQTITLYNDPMGGLELIKVNADDTRADSQHYI